jgi:hypothetical protein
MDRLEQQYPVDAVEKAFDVELASTLVVEFSGGSAVSDCGAVEVAIGPVG